MGEGGHRLHLPSTILVSDFLFMERECRNVLVCVKVTFPSTSRLPYSCMSFSFKERGCRVEVVGEGDIGSTSLVPYSCMSLFFHGERVEDGLV